jgi:hypothetical protein
MNIITIIFAWCETYLLFWDSKDFTKTKAQAIGWYDSIRFDEEVPVSERTWKWHFRKYSEMWGAKIAVAVVYLWGIKAIQDLLNPKKKKSDGDDDN